MEIINFSKYFVENIAYLSTELNIPIVYKLEPNKEYIIFSAHDAAKDLLEFQLRNKTKYLIYQSENIESVFFKNKYYIQLLKHNRVLHYSVYTASKCKELYNIDCAGYFQFNYKPINLNMKRDIDIFFFGTMTQKRYDILKEIQNTFPKLIIEIACDAFGSVLDNLLCRSKYVLNISAYDNSVLETHRINKAISCGCEVISNLSVDEKMNQKYNPHIFFCGKTISDYIEKIKIIFPKHLIR
jgi:hypothetical protein